MYHIPTFKNQNERMKIIIQRVSKASVVVENKIISEINNGMLVLLGIGNEDTLDDIKWLVNKLCNIRIFPDENKVMNLSLKEVNGEVIVVSQFTLMASTKKGNRPSYIKAAKPEISIPLYKLFVQQLEESLNKKVGTGIFGADMQVSLTNDGPVTISIDSKNRV
jgi:D-tyrosyl-tRNA(Tyr) deacylase